MKSSSRHYEHQQDTDLKRLQVMIPSDCPLIVKRLAPGTRIGGFVVSVLGAEHAKPERGVSGCSGRFQVVAAWISGYLTAWYRARAILQANGEVQALVSTSGATVPEDLLKALSDLDWAAQAFTSAVQRS